MPDTPLDVFIFGDLPSLLWAAAALVFAYTLFALAGFGSALVASAPLAAVVPVAKVVPLLALLDCAGSGSRGWKARRRVAWGELKRLLPGMLGGQLLGVFILARLPLAAMALLLGGFVAAYGVFGLLGNRRGMSSASYQHGAWLHGLLGGILGGLFGSGGFVYAAYLERRLENRDDFRATQAVLIALSTAWRVGLCASAGLIDLRLLATALVLLPLVGIGGWLGKRIDLHLSRQQLFQGLNILLVASGVGLMARYLG